MPAIQKEMRLTIEGVPMPIPVMRSTLHVDSCEQISLEVKGLQPPVPKAASAAKPATAKPVKAKLVTAKPQKRVNQVIYTPTLTNVKFVVIYDAGRGSGLKVKVGKSKLQALTQPLVFMDGNAANFGNKLAITVENDSMSDRTAILLVGSDLPKGAIKIQPTKIVRLPATSGAKPVPAAAPAPAPAVAAAPKKAASKSKRKTKKR